MLWTNWNEIYFDNMPIGCNLDELIGEQEETKIDIFNSPDWDFS
mgnify:CR=1 FL=1